MFWVLRQKVNMPYEVVERREESGNIISDEVVRLTAANTAEKYPQTFRRIQAVVEVNGESREMTLSSSPDGTRRSPASLESCVLRCGWIWTSWRPCAYMGWHHPRIDRDRTAFSSIWRAFEPQILNLVG